MTPLSNKGNQSSTHASHTYSQSSPSSGHSPDRPGKPRKLPGQGDPLAGLQECHPRDTGLRVALDSKGLECRCLQAPSSLTGPPDTRVWRKDTGRRGLDELGRAEQRPFCRARSSR